MPDTIPTPVAADSSGSASPTPSTPATPAAAATPPAVVDGGAAPAKPSTKEPAEGNAFTRAAKGFSEKLQDRLEKAEKGLESDPGAGKPAEGTPEAKDGAPKGEKLAEKQSEKPQQAREERSAELTFIGKDGKPVPFQWPEGAVIRFKGSGRQQVVDTPAKALELMQKGADYGPTTARLGEERATVERQLKAAQEASQRMMLAVLFGDGEQSAEEVREALLPTMEKFLDPEYRRGQEAVARETAAQQQARQQAEEDAKAYTEAIYADAEDYIGSKLDGFEFLQASDTAVVQHAMHAEYEAQFNAKLNELLPDLRAQRLTPEQVQDIAETHARGVFTTGTLDALMGRLNDEYKRRIGARGGAGAPASSARTAADDSGAASRAIDAHNARTDSKLEQQERTRSLRGAGTPPAAAPGNPDTSTMTFDERRKFNSSRLRRLGA